MYANIRRILILVLGAYLCASCQPIPIIPSLTGTPLPDPDIEEVVVYNALLGSQFAGHELGQILISYELSQLDHFSNVEGHLIEIETD